MITKLIKLKYESVNLYNLCINNIMKGEDVGDTEAQIMAYDDIRCWGHAEVAQARKFYEYNIMNLY